MLTKEAMKISSKNKICSLGLKMSLRHHLLPQIDCASYTHVNSEKPIWNVINASWSDWINTNTQQGCRCWKHK